MRFMNPRVLEKVKDAPDFLALTEAMMGLCEPFGPIHAMRLVHNKRAHSVTFQIELDSPKRHAALSRELGVTGSGDSVCVALPVRPDFHHA